MLVVITNVKIKIILAEDDMRMKSYIYTQYYIYGSSSAKLQRNITSANVSNLYVRQYCH
jgi:hypothetical protein